MDILPIQSIREEDAPIVGKEIVYLAKLSHNHIPVSSGIVVFPPEFSLKTVLERHELVDREVFEQKLEIIREEIKSIPIPEELQIALADKQLDLNKLWHHLLSRWLHQIRSRVWREGLGKGVTNNLTAQPVFFTKTINASGRVYIDYDLKKAVIETEFGSLDEEHLSLIGEIAKSANNLLYLPHVYEFIINETEKNKGEIQLVRVLPFTQYPDKAIQNKDENLDEVSIDLPKRIKKSVLKVFLTDPHSIPDSLTVDGVVLNAENYQSMDEKVERIAKIKEDMPQAKVFYKLADVNQNHSDVRGALRLIHQQSLLEEDIETIAFLKQKRGYKNITIVVPFVRSSEELMQIKTKLSQSKLLTVAGDIWMEVATVENVLNIENYLKASIHGVIINLDLLSQFIAGFSNDIEAAYYQKQVSSLVGLLDNCFRILTKHQIKIVVVGNLALDIDVLHHLIKKGLWGVGVKWAESLGVHEYIKQVERRIVKSHSSQL